MSLDLDTTPSTQDTDRGPSILFPPGGEPAAAAEPVPAYFADLNLDQLEATVLAGRQEYDLSGLFRRLLRTVGEVRLRHQVFADLEQEGVLGTLEEFGAQMREVRRRIGMSKQLRYDVQKHVQVLAAVGFYLDAVQSLHDGLVPARLSSAALRAFLDHLGEYVGGEAFRRLRADHDRALDGLLSVRYRMRLVGSRIEVSRVRDDEPDYAAEVMMTFNRFRQGEVKGRASKLKSYLAMNHVEAAVMDRVALLNPEPFRLLALFSSTHADFQDEAVLRFDRESQFYLAWCDFMRRVTGQGLRFCRPSISDSPDEVDTAVTDSFDAALAAKLVVERGRTVTNGFALCGEERLLVVSGPNQGGKTTFARMVGQVHHLAALGLPVPGTEARLPLVDAIHTHFERGENWTELSGKLEDDVVRIHDIITKATSRSLVILNEIFTSTSLEDADVLGREVLHRLIDRRCSGVFVTFLDELSRLGPATVSMVSEIDPDDPTRRTFQVRRREADGLAYAQALAHKYRLDEAALKRRLAR